MRKFTLFLAALCCTVMANAWNLQVDGICYNVNWSDETAVVTYETTDPYSYNYKNFTGAITIPATVRGDLTDFTVVAIGDSAFMNANITNIDMSQTSITRIGKRAFYECDRLSTVSLPSTLKTIDMFAFYKIPITSIDLPDHLQIIGQGAFDVCKNLTSIRIPESVTEIGHAAFEWCISLTHVVLPSSRPKMRETSFRLCNALNLIENYAVTPQDISIYVFCEIDEPGAITLRVPKGSKPAYEAVAGWKVMHIEEMDQEDIEQPTSDSSLKGGEKFLRDGQLLIEKNGKTYNALGAEIK